METGNRALNRTNTLLTEIFKNRYIYLLLIPGLAFYIIFCYFPMYGVTIAFKDYKANLGIFASPFVGLQNYEYVFRDANFFKATFNTLIISFQRIIFQFPVPIVLALFINEIRTSAYKRVLQTVYTLPHFLSWVIISGIIINLLENDGAVNNLMALLGFERQSFLGNAALFRPLLYISESWKSAGWTSIIYLAAIAGINFEQYESAIIDGATRFQKMLYITLPGIKNTIMVMFILAVGNVMNAGFDQIFNMYNPAVYDAADILDTYIYRITFQSGADFGFSAAIGLFKSVINFILLMAADRVAKMLGESGLFN